MAKEKFKRGKPKMSFDQILNKVAQPSTPEIEKMRRVTLKRILKKKTE